MTTRPRSAATRAPAHAGECRLPRCVLVVPAPSQPRARRARPARSRERRARTGKTRSDRGLVSDRAPLPTAPQPLRVREHELHQFGDGASIFAFSMTATSTSRARRTMNSWIWRISSSRTGTCPSCASRPRRRRGRRSARRGCSVVDVQDALHEHRALDAAGRCRERGGRLPAPSTSPPRARGRSPPARRPIRSGSARGSRPPSGRRPSRTPRVRPRSSSSGSTA